MAEKKESVEAAVRTIRRVTRKKYSAEDKVRIVLEGLGVRPASPPCTAERGSHRTCTIDGARTSSRWGNNAWWATPGARQTADR